MRWTGIAVLLPQPNHPSLSEGYVGAFAPIACEGDSLSEAINKLSEELLGNQLFLVGLEDCIAVGMRDRILTEEEEELVSALDTYPVQFKNVHFHKADS